MLIELRNICKIYGNGNVKIDALKDINIDIDEGEFIAIVGTSGSGKSTLLNILGGITKPTIGDYFINGQKIISYSEKQMAELRNKTFGFVLQYFGLLKDYTVSENIEITLEYAKVKKKIRKEKVKEVLKKLKIEEKYDNIPSELSGGQCQRVAIARAIINKPKVILADEPTGALDKKMSKEVMEIFKELNLEGKTIIIVTHDESIANCCNRIIKIEDGQIIKDIKVR